MHTGMASRFNILQQFPYDLGARGDAGTAGGGSKICWVPSRYYIRADTKDGWLIVWNSHRRSFNVFSADQRSAIEGLLSKKGFSAEATGVVNIFPTVASCSKRDTAKSSSRSELPS
jgi:hypothetical protein